jgi:hypothetical protein
LCVFACVVTAWHVCCVSLRVCVMRGLRCCCSGLSVPNAVLLGDLAWRLVERFAWDETGLAKLKLCVQSMRLWLCPRCACACACACGCASAVAFVVAVGGAPGRSPPTLCPRSAALALSAPVLRVRVRVCAPSLIRSLPNLAPRLPPVTSACSNGALGRLVPAVRWLQGMGATPPVPAITDMALRVLARLLGKDLRWLLGVVSGACA